MKRIHLFEFEDQSWFPDSIRGYMTNLLAVLHRMVGTKEVIAGILGPLISKNRFGRMVDLGSGSGGIMPEVLNELKQDYGHKDLELLLTDLYPNKDLVNKWAGSEGIEYKAEAVDATNWEEIPAGLKTMVNCFHHLKPDNARKILKEASLRGEALFIYEMGENKIPLVLWWVLLPISLVILVLMALIMTFWVRPLNWKQLLFTYLIPVVPICYAWDGQVSIVRMYTMKDLDELLEGLDTSEYYWQKGKAFKKNKKQLGTFLMGLPGNN